MTSPKATFESIVAHPKPAGIMLLAIAIIAGASAAPQFTESGRQLLLSTQIQARERSTGQPMTPEQQAGLERFSQYTPYATIVSIFIFAPIVVMFFTALYWVLFNSILGGTATFRQVLAIVAHSSIIGAIGTAIGAPIMYAQGKISQAGPFNLGALAPGGDPDGFVHHFLSGLTVFQIWGCVVTAIGLSVLYRRKAGGITVALLLIYAAFAAVIAYFFGRFMGS